MAGIFYAKCMVCGINISHGGVNGVKKHIKTSNHQQAGKSASFF